ncbi:hypothetical protein Sta7437_2489 [Stanieria cyanosphaera PCC 7437]|uniref:Uncharacterized protein n=1 Tax=Stanieria cyanosphaera (strain ATCC 29371 / PCC 7437) TaxID=111780 RepID=K9XWH8_STAC7|nr:hypothetical protein [Stanieria cyanosphaera]AFZ36022.1 hypothetical protein Sta7437_2489 [Stanieria cyanosphaera PCC 7437]
MSSLIKPFVVAHNIKTDGNVGVTFHIEPNHSPRAGENAIAWFALTRQGGESIPLSQCDCNLAVYQQSSPTQPILNPTLQSLDPEAQYQKVPGTTIIFPEAGSYQLEISGKPKLEGDFKPFKLSYTVNVSPGITQSTQEQNSQPNPIILATNNRNNQSSLNFLPWLFTAIAGMIIIAMIFKTRKSRTKSSTENKE